MKQIALPIGLERAPVFSSYIAGANGAVVAHLRALDSGAAPCYLWGPAGVGKTHLLHACGDHVRERGGRSAWFDGRVPPPWTVDAGTALITIDDCQALDAGRQHAAFALFVEAAVTGVPIVAAGRLPPVDLPLREDLRTRLGWGHVFAVAPLSEAETRAALRREADRRGLFLPDEVIDYLLNHFARDLKHLSQQLDALDAYALAEKRAPTLPLLLRMLAEPPDPDDDA
jgi:DnaA family protein